MTHLPVFCDWAVQLGLGFPQLSDCIRREVFRERDARVENRDCLVNAGLPMSGLLKLRNTAEPQACMMVSAK